MSGADWEKPSTHASRRKWATVALLVAGVVALGLVARAGIAEPPGTIAVEPERSPSPSPSPSPSARPSPRPTPSETPAPGVWELFPPSPLGDVFEAGVASTGDQLLVWGGTRNPFGRRTFSAEGAAFDIDRSGEQLGDRRFDGAWRPFPPAPLRERAGHAMAWTGTELIVWGGQGAAELFADGAAYDPVTEHWRPLAPSPLSPRAGAAAVWTGTELVVLAGWDNAGPLDDSGAYDPVSDRWRRLAPAPPGLAGAGGLQGLWDGESVVVWTPEPSPNGTGLAKYHPDTDSWTSLPTPPSEQQRGALTAVVWSGAELYAIRATTGGFRLWSLAPDRPVWRERPSPPVRSYPSFAAWTGEQLAVVSADYSLRAQFFDPGGGTWSYTLLASLEPSALTPTVPGVWAGEELVILTGGSTVGAAYRVPPLPPSIEGRIGTSFTLGS